MKRSAFIISLVFVSFFVQKLNCMHNQEKRKKIVEVFQMRIDKNIKEKRMHRIDKQLWYRGKRSEFTDTEAKMLCYWGLFDNSLREKYRIWKRYEGYKYKIFYDGSSGSCCFEVNFLLKSDYDKEMQKVVTAEQKEKEKIRLEEERMKSRIEKENHRRKSLYDAKKTKAYAELKKHSNWKILEDDKGFYLGEAQNGNAHGQGKYVWKITGKIMNEKGITFPGVTDKKCNYYIGQFENGKLHGKGEYYYYSVCNYDTEKFLLTGNYSNGKRHGHGIVRSLTSTGLVGSQTYYEGEWTNGKLLHRYDDNENNKADNAYLKIKFHERKHK